MTRDKKGHDETLEKLLHAPHLLGIEGPVHWAVKQMQLYKSRSRDLLTDIDLVYRTDSDLWIVEYKTSPGHANKAYRQLDIAKEFVQREFRVNPSGLYVCSPSLLRVQVF